MKYLKTFENQQLPSINILLDVSGSVSKELVKAAFYLTDFGEYNKVMRLYQKINFFRHKSHSAS